MKERILFIIAVAFIVLMTVIEARQDYWIITSGATAGKWKLWGNAYSFGWILAGGLAVSYLRRSWTILLWIPILWMWWWMTHDAFIGIFLVGNPLYVGVVEGSWDQYFARIFQQSGVLYMGIRMIWTFLMITGYWWAEYDHRKRWEAKMVREAIDEYAPDLDNRPSIDANDVFLPDEKLKED